MPTVVGIRVKCPECGATTQAVGDHVKCQYCGTESRVQRRTTVFQQPIPLPPPLANNPPRVAVQQKNNVVPWIFGLTIFSMVVPIAAVSLTAAKRSHDITTKYKQAAAVKPHEITYRDWETAHPWFADVDGDGVADVLGIVRYVSNRDEMHFAAHSSKDGHLLWETPSLGTYSDTYRAKIVVDSGTILWGSESSTRLLAIDVASGKKKWEVQPQEGVERFCRANDQIYVELKDETMWSIDRGTGGLAKLAKPIACKNTQFESDSATGSEWWHANLAGVSLDHAFVVPEGWIVTATKSPGTPIPMILAVDKKKKELWRTVVPPVDPMSAQRPPWPDLGIDDTAVATSVVYDKKPARIEIFDRKSGTRLIDIPLVAEPGSFITNQVPISLQGALVFAAMPDGLHAYDRNTGKRRWMIARMQ